MPPEDRKNANNDDHDDGDRGDAVVSAAGVYDVGWLLIAHGTLVPAAVRAQTALRDEGENAI